MPGVMGYSIHVLWYDLTIEVGSILTFLNSNKVKGHTIIQGSVSDEPTTAVLRYKITVQIKRTPGAPLTHFPGRGEGGFLFKT